MDTKTLIPGLPYDLSALILLHVPYAHHARIRSTSKSWRSFYASKTLTSLRHVHLTRSHLLLVFPQDPSIASPYMYDPKASGWSPLPHMPCNPRVYGLCNFTCVSTGRHVYLIGGSMFDAGSYPTDRPSPSSESYRLDVVLGEWERVCPMVSPRGSFACAVSGDESIFVAGGGSRHTVFGAAGSRLNSVERYDIQRDKWVALDGLPHLRAGSTGFLVGNGEDREFWVMGGYGECRTVSGVFPIDRYYRDAVVMQLNGGAWKEVGDMWEESERERLGKVVVLSIEDQAVPDIFMLDQSEIFRYDMSSNRWHKESRVPRKARSGGSFGFVELEGELYVMCLLNGVDHHNNNRKSRDQKGSTTLYIQIYHPINKTWRSKITKPPFNYPLDFKSAVMCTIRL